MMENKFLSILSEQDFIKRYKELKNNINNNIYIKEKYDELFSLQKKMLKYKDEDIKKRYNALYDEILSYPFMEEYFSLVNQIDEFLHQVMNIIEMEL